MPHPVLTESMAAAHVYRHISSVHSVFPLREGTLVESLNRRASIIQVMVSMVRVLYSLLSRWSTSLPKLYLSVSFTTVLSEDEVGVSEDDDSVIGEMNIKLELEDFTELDDFAELEDFSELEDLLELDDLLELEDFSELEDFTELDDSSEFEDFFELEDISELEELESFTNVEGSTTQDLPSHLNCDWFSAIVTTIPSLSLLHSRCCSSVRLPTTSGNDADDASDEESLQAKMASEMVATAKLKRFMVVPP